MKQKFDKKEPALVEIDKLLEEGMKKIVQKNLAPNYAGKIRKDCIKNNHNAQ